MNATQIKYSLSKLLRNPELFRGAALSAALAAAFAAAAFIWDVRFGIFTLALGIAMLAAQFTIVYRRYARLAALAANIDRVLNDNCALLPEGYAEGELDILGSELYKLTVSLRQQRELLMADKTRLAELLADVSHQIRTPLSIVSLLTDSLARTGPNDGRRTELAGRIEALLCRIDRLLVATLKLARLDAGAAVLTRENCELRELVCRAAEPLGVLFELRGVKLDFDCSGCACVDKQWTAEAICNLIKNCAEHSPEGGTVKVKAYENALYSAVEVSDDGPGIAAADLPRVFERFYSRSDNGAPSGFGIGLSLCQRITRTQGGVVTAGNKPGGGAVFTVKFYKSTV